MLNSANSCSTSSSQGTLQASGHSKNTEPEQSNHKKRFSHRWTERWPVVRHHIANIFRAKESKSSATPLSKRVIEVEKVHKPVDKNPTLAEETISNSIDSPATIILDSNADPAAQNEAIKISTENSLRDLNINSDFLTIYKQDLEEHKKQTEILANLLSRQADMDTWKQREQDILEKSKQVIERQSHTIKKLEQENGALRSRNEELVRLRYQLSGDNIDLQNTTQYWSDAYFALQQVKHSIPPSSFDTRRTPTLQAIPEEPEPIQPTLSTTCSTG
ncbi:hypothetical protein [Endozoicomonas ascidiicola]|uniref:hypothetical protein n=1 Tax=Endozoicomonas ascidiicola TaxID=1698521 RepID=UPI00082D458C|nr:hypothetical protein [Endozoicomonas ascidiicola]